MKLKKLIIGTLIVFMITSSSIITPIRFTATTVDTVSGATEGIDKNTITTTPTPTVIPTSGTPKSFIDITKESKYYAAVNYLAEIGALGGYKDGTFKPKTNITNTKFLCILMSAIDESLPRATLGTDYDTKVLQKAFEYGIVTKKELNSAKYNKALTRGDMALWTARAMEYSGEEMDDLYNINNLILDYSKIPTKYQKSVRNLYSEGIITNATFNSSGKVTRGTAVTIIIKVIDYSSRKDMSKI